MTARRQLGFLWGAVAVALVALSPLARELAAVVPACPVKSWLALPCATCGTTRAALALARLDLAAALAVNPLATIGWVGLIGGGAAAGALSIVDRQLPVPEPRPTRALRIGVALALLVNWVYLVAAGT